MIIAGDYHEHEHSCHEYNHTVLFFQTTLKIQFYIFELDFIYRISLNKSRIQIHVNACLDYRPGVFKAL